MKKIAHIILVANLFLSVLYAQKKPAAESFEHNAILSKYKSSASSVLSISNKHYKFGKQALKWEWQGESSFSTSNFKMLSLEESPLSYGAFFPASPTLIFSLYNEIPQKETIKVSYGSHSSEEVWFEVSLNFKGWRTLWVPFYEMQGNTPQKNEKINYNTFKVSTKAAQGKLYFDDIVFSQYQDNRHPSPDEIAPFIKNEYTAEMDTWMAILSDYKRIKNYKSKPISSKVKSDLKVIEAKLDADFRIPDQHELNISDLKERFSKLMIVIKGNTVVGPPLEFVQANKNTYRLETLQKHTQINFIRDFGKAMKKLAVYHDRAFGADKKDLEEMFITGTKYFLDQGWQAGASGGTKHHIGYAIRELTGAFFIMRDVLKAEDLLNEIGGSLQWLYNYGTILDHPTKFHVNVDYLNTKSFQHLLLSFLTEDENLKGNLLSAYSNYLSIILAQQNEKWGFKVDGTVWHHNGHYPAYGIGAFRTISKVVNFLSGTSFRVGIEGHKNFKNAFLATRLYSHKFDWGFGNSGRHPLENGGIKKLKSSYLLLANAGNPEGTSVIDKEVAGAYIRLWGNEDKLNSDLFKKRYGITGEVLHGYNVFPYGATAIHRRGNWAAIIKGYSKYVWASETYVTSNRYGRYQSNGTIQLLNSKGEKGSGFRQEGWDWNRYPGATVIYLPLEELEPKNPLIMFRSKETFAGAIEFNGDGVFGMILNESKGVDSGGFERSVFKEKLFAKKSVFSFGEKLICIGTDISSIDQKNPVHTNLFQTHIENKNSSIYVSSEGKFSSFPLELEVESDTKSNKKWLIDPYKNGYVVLSDNTIVFSKKEQHSYHNKYSVRTGKIDKA
ncbi:chondroitinase family polysaccharide lyase, partial [Tamlana sp. 2201CG12-4]|uniref:chondroitinase family polysaccharide lyase n=1 Tax=Tamlana sp. 2201CG12-4 TaxID=3112582 RepID=UPI002DBFA368